MGETELEQQVEEALELDEIEESSKTLALLYDTFKRLGYDLANRKKRAPIRVLESLLFGEFHDIELSGKGEKNLLDLCKQVVYHKGRIYNKLVEKEMENGPEPESE